LELKVLDLFAGIGGFTLGLERAGFETAAFCEIDPYAQKVLRKNWPGVPIYDDVRDITAERLVSDGVRVDVITGGFPCQDISLAGRQSGIDGERSGLWSECARLLGELRPKYAIFENVTNLLNGERGDWFKRVLWDISAVGYDAEWHCIPASAIGAHHHRDRV
jgi:DNA (cytosine-5)-methyltransferase 1